MLAVLATSKGRRLVCCLSCSAPSTPPPWKRSDFRRCTATKAAAVVVSNSHQPPPPPPPLPNTTTTTNKNNTEQQDAAAEAEGLPLQSLRGYRAARNYLLRLYKLAPEKYLTATESRCAAVQDALRVCCGRYCFSIAVRCVHVVVGVGGGMNKRLVQKGRMRCARAPWCSDAKRSGRREEWVGERL